MTRKTQIGIVLAGLFFALVGFTIAYRLKMADGSHEALQAPADPTPA